MEVVQFSVTSSAPSRKDETLVTVGRRPTAAAGTLPPAGKLRVSNICDKNWNNCKKIADLNTWIKINWTNGLICVKVNDKEINCNKTVINNNPTLTWWQQKTIGTVWGTGLTVTMPANPHIEWTNIVGTSENATTNANTTNTTTYLNHVENNRTTSSTKIQWAGATTVTASNWDITITSKDTKWRTVVTNSNTSTSSTNTSNPYLNYVDDRNGSEAVVNGVQIHWGGYTTVESNGNVITISSTPWPGNELHYTGRNVLGNAGTTNNNVVATDNTNTYLNHVEGSTVQNSLQIKWTEWVSVSSKNGVLTISGSSTTVTNNNNPTLSRWNTSTIGTINGKDLKVTMPSNPSSATANNPTLSRWTTSTIGTVNGTQLKVTMPSNPWWWDSIWSTWNYSTIGDFITPKDAKTIYFGNKGETTIYYWTLLGSPTLKFQRYWLNASTSPVEFNAMWAKFWVNSSLAKTSTVGWVSIAWELLVWNAGSENYIRMYSSGSTSNDNNRHYEIMASKELALWTYSGAYLYFKNYNNWSDYKQYRIWVNNSSPQATLDVKWSIRVNTDNTDCFPTCNSSSAWSIIYRGNEFYWCKDDGHWYKFNMTQQSSYSTTLQCSASVNPVYNNLSS